MPQISLYVDESTLKKVERAASKQQVSISRWVVEQIRARVEPVYPADYESLFGSISDPSFVRPKNLSLKKDAPRESL